MIASMYITNAKLLQLQELVKYYDLRFCGDPIISGSQAFVRISAEHLPPGGANAFFAAWERLNRPIVEVRRSGLSRLWRKVRGRFLAMLPS